MVKPDAPSCSRNREPILGVLRRHFTDRQRVLEIGSGTGQHAVFFAAGLPHLIWQASDRTENLPGIRAWCEEAQLPNLPEPIEFDVNGAWPVQRYDAVFTANTLHILSWREVETLFDGLPQVLEPGAILAAYGPFNREGRFTSPGNADFDVWLKARGAHQGIRDFEAVDALARAIGLRLIEDCALPANNCCLLWRLD